MEMNRGMKWLTWALCVSSLGALGELSAAAFMGSVFIGSKIIGSLVVSLLGIAVICCAPICLLIGIVLGVVGLRMLDKT